MLKEWMWKIKLFESRKTTPVRKHKEGGVLCPNTKETRAIFPQGIEDSLSIYLPPYRWVVRRQCTLPPRQFLKKVLCWVFWAPRMTAQDTEPFIHFCQQVLAIQVLVLTMRTARAVPMILTGDPRKPPGPEGPCWPTSPLVPLQPS